MKHQVKVHLGLKKWKTTNSKNIKKAIEEELIPALDQNMREILFSKKDQGVDSWSKFKQTKAGLFVENTMRYLEKSKSLDKALSYAQYIPASDKDTVVLHAALTEDAQEETERESNEYIMKAVLAFDPQQAERIFDRVVSENLER